MSTTCDTVAERVALGEPLGDAAEHAASCARCRRLAALPTKLVVMHREADPGLGFSARMTAGAQHRIVVRKRRRVAAGLAVAVAATSLGVFVVTREPAKQQIAGNPPHEPQPGVKPRETDEAANDEDVRALLHLANTERAAKYSANWAQITKSLKPYRVVLQGVDHE